MFARVSLVVFWLVMTVLGLIVVKRKLSDDSFSFRGEFPFEIPSWGYVIVPLAVLSFIYLTMLTVLYVWVPTLVPNFVYFSIPLDAFLLEVLPNLGAGLTILGTSIFFTAFFHLGSSVRLLIPKEEEKIQLMTDGWYGHSRNPLYLGLHIAMIGWIFIFPSLLTGLALVVFLLNQHFRILQEERFLEDKFGDEYREYKKRVRRYL